MTKKIYVNNISNFKQRTSYNYYFLYFNLYYINLLFLFKRKKKGFLIPL